METLLQGVLLGGLYGLFALGLSLMFGVMRLTNTAHGDFIILGSFATLSVVSTGLTPIQSVFVTLPIAWLMGYALQRYVLNGTLGKDPLPSLVVTFGLSIVTQNFLLELFSADPRSIETEGFNTLGWAVTDSLSVGVLPVLILGLAIATTFFLQWLFKYTSIGRSFRAVSDDPEIAELMGLNSKKVYALATGLAFVLMSISGSLQGMRTTVSPSDGPMLLLFAFEAVIIGGMGSFWGTIAGAMILGIAQQMGFRWDPGWGLWCGHVIFLIILIVRPQGLFPKTRG
jgi:branched-chain amino acid transport system permease protein